MDSLTIVLITLGGAVAGWVGARLYGRRMVAGCACCSGCSCGPNCQCTADNTCGPNCTCAVR